MSIVRRFLFAFSACIILSALACSCTPACSAEDQSKACIPAPLSGVETARIVSKIYDKIGPRFGCVFVDANVVLTLSGAKGNTNFFLAYPQSGYDRTLLSLNEILEPMGIKIGSFIPQPNSNIILVNIENLKGYERASKLTKFPFCTPFDAATGWKGVLQSNRAMWDDMEKTGVPRDRIIYTIMNLNQGYPDMAIQDYNDCEASGRAFRLVNFEIPLSKRYYGGDASFLLRPEHIDDPAITATAETWSAILKGFYRSTWHKAREKDPHFLEARKNLDAAMERAIHENMKESPPPGTRND
jgi:hypothetical protein